MKKIEFGFSNDNNPTGSWEGFAINRGVRLYDAEYYGTIQYEDDNYLVAKVSNDEGNDPNFYDKFIVRPAIADVYMDGSGRILLDQEQSMIGQQIENFLNNPDIKDKVHNVNDITYFCDGTHIVNDISFTLLTMPDSLIATSIRHDVFETKNNNLKALHNYHKPLSELAAELSLTDTNNFSK